MDPLFYCLTFSSFYEVIDASFLWGAQLQAVFWLGWGLESVHFKMCWKLSFLFLPSGDRHMTVSCQEGCLQERNECVSLRLCCRLLSEQVLFLLIKHKCREAFPKSCFSFDFICSTFEWWFEQLLTDTSSPSLAAEKWVLAGCVREAEGLMSSVTTMEVWLSDVDECFKSFLL